MSSNCSYGEHSSSEEGYVSERWIGEDHYGFIEFCKCGSPMFMAREKAPAHRGRIYLKCFNYRDGDDHCSKWFDECIDEEIKNIKLVAKQHTEELGKLRQRLNASVEPFSVRFSHEVTKLNICICNLQRELETIDRKYANICNVPGFYESRQGWLKYAYARALGPAYTAIENVPEQMRFTRKWALVFFALGSFSACVYAIWRKKVGL